MRAFCVWSSFDPRSRLMIFWIYGRGRTMATERANDLRAFKGFIEEKKSSQTTEPTSRSMKPSFTGTSKTRLTKSARPRFVRSTTGLPTSTQDERDRLKNSTASFAQSIASPLGHELPHSAIRAGRDGYQPDFQLAFRTEPPRHGSLV